MAEDIGTLAVRIAMEDSNFQQGIQNLKRSINVIDSSFKTSISGIKDWGKNLDNLKSNSQSLGEKIQAQTKIVETYSNQLKKSKESLQDNASKMMELKSKVEASKSAWEESKSAIGSNAEETKKLEKTYKDLSDEYTKQESKVRNNEKSIQGYTIQINNANSKLKSFQNELKKSNEQINNFKLKSLSDSFDQLGNKFKSIGDGMKTIGSSMMLKVTAPIVAGFGVSAKSASSFEHQMADIRKELVASGESTSEVDSTMKEMSSDSLKWGSDFGQSTDDINAGLLTLKKDGYSGKEAIDDMSTSLYTARGANENLFDVINTLGGSLEAYGMKTENAAKNTQNMAHIADSFSYIANHTKASVTSLGEGFSVAGQTLSAMHQPLEVTAAALGELASSNIDASTAATALKAGFVNLTKPSDEMSAAMQRMKLNVFDAKGQMKDLPTILDNIAKGTKGWTEEERNNAVATVFGKDSLASWNALLNKGGDNLRQLSNGAKNSTGEVKNLSDAMKDTPQNKFKELQGSVHALGVAFGEDILPIFTPVIQGITNIIKGFSQLNDGTKKTIITLAGIAAATGAFVFGTSKIIGGISNINKSFSNLFKYMAKHDVGTKFATIFSGLTTGLSTTGGAISTFIFGPWNLLKDGLKSLPGLITSFSFAGIAEKLTGPFKKLPSLFIEILANMKGAIGKIPGLLGIFKTSLVSFGTTVIALGPKVLVGIKSMFSIQGIMTGAKAALGLFTNPWGALILVIVAGVGAIIANWSKITTFARKIFGGGTTQIFTQFKQVFTQIGADLKADVTAVWSYIGPTINSAVTQIKAFWDAVWPEIKQVFVEVWDVMKVLLAPAMAIMYTAISTGIGVIKGIWGPAWNALKDELKLIWDAMSGVIKIAWDLISGVIKVGLDLATGHWSKAWGDFKSIFSNVWSDLKSSVSNIAKDALNWGKDIIQGIIDGIKSGVKSLEGAVSNVAKTIWSYLHHSTPEEGPLKDDDTYMPDMLKNMADGIKKNKGIVANALKELSTDMSDKLKISGSANLGTVAVTKTSTGGNSKDEQKNGQSMNESLGKGLTNSQNSVMTPIKTLKSTISNTMSNLVQSFIQNGHDADSNLGNGITTNTNSAMQPLKTVISTATDNINTFVNAAVGHGQDTDKNLGTGITTSSNEVISSMNNVTTTVGTNLNAFATSSVKYGQSTDINIAAGITTTSNNVISAVNNLTTNISNILKTFATSCNTIGKSIGDSIASGMKASEDNAVNIAHELAKKVIDAFTSKDGFDIHSPSRRLFAIGKYVIQGFINGISSQDALAIFKNKIGSMIGATGSMGGGIAQAIMAGIMMEGAPASWFLPLEMIASRESGDPGKLGTGNPFLVNDVAVGNEYASGLMQVLPSTFRSFFGSDAGLFNSVMSVRAAIREIRENWGGNPYNITGLMNGNGYMGYAAGTDNANKGWHWVGENGPELMWFGGGEKVINSRISSALMSGLSNGKNLISSLLKNLNLGALSFKSNNSNISTSDTQSVLDIAKDVFGGVNLNTASSSTQQIIIPINLNGEEIARVIAKPSDKIQGRNIRLAKRGRGL